VCWRAAVETTPGEERDALAALLRVWSGQPFAERGSRWRTGRAPYAGVEARRAAGGLLATGAGQDGAVRFLQSAAEPAPDGAEDVATVTVGRDDAARLPGLLELVERHGPLPLAAEAVDVFARRTGVRRPVAALVLAGLPRREGYDEDRRMLRSKPYAATKAVVDAYRSLWNGLGAQGRAAVLAAGVPEDPAELWAAGGMAAAAGGWPRCGSVWPAGRCTSTRT
jgi:hypothetical protein